MKELLKSYRETLYELQKVKIGADKERNVLKELAEKEPTEENKERYERAQELCDTVNAFISNVVYVIAWLSRGHAPNPRRAIHRRSREQREVLMEPLKMQSYANPAACGSPTTITDSERFMIDEALHTLTKKEKDCYMLKYGQCFSERDIARMLNISQQAVNQNIKRAEAKINDSIRNNIFLPIA
ncbi:positive control sigma-like factor [compost metagenome]